MSGVASLEYYYYISSEGLIKSYLSAPIITTVENPDGTGEIATITRECILVNTNPL